MLGFLGSINKEYFQVMYILSPVLKKVFFYIFQMFVQSNPEAFKTCWFNRNTAFEKQGV